MQVVYQVIFVLLPVLGLILPSLFKSDGLKPHTNAIIGLVTIVVISAAQAWSAGRLGLNAYVDFAVIFGGIYAILNGTDFSEVAQYIQTNLGVKIQNVIPVTPVSAITTTLPVVTPADQNRSDGSIK